MVRRVLIVLCIGIMITFMANCGQTYTLQSITVTPASPNIEGIGSSQALVVTANYSNSKTEDVTTKSTYQLGPSTHADAPLTAMNVNASGIVKAINAACTWTATLNPDGATYGYTTNPYLVTATYSGFTTQAFVSVDSAGGCYDGLGFPAPTPK
jgi:hypothetical protein